MPPLFEKIDSNYFFDRTSFFLRFFLAQVDFIFPTVDCRFPTVGKVFPTVGKRHLSTVRLSGNDIYPQFDCRETIPDCREKFPTVGKIYLKKTKSDEKHSENDGGGIKKIFW